MPTKDHDPLYDARASILVLQTAIADLDHQKREAVAEVARLKAVNEDLRKRLKEAEERNTVEASTL